MSRRMVGATMLAVALLTGCAEDDDALQADEQEVIAHERAEHGDGTTTEEQHEPIADSQQALTAPSFALITQSGKALTAGSTEVGTLVVQKSLLGAKGGPTQRWVSVNQNFTLESKPNLCLQATSGSPGAKLRLQPCNGGPLQGWRLELTVQNGVKLTRWKNLPSGLYLDNAGSNSEGSAMVVRTFSGLASQLFNRLF